MDEFKNFFFFIKENHRRILWITLGLLFVVDIITTTIGLQKGGYEQTPFMIPFVENPMLHLFIKIIAFIIILGVVEGAFILINKISFDEKFSWNKLCYFIAYALIIFGLLDFI
jgi:hypothetical protein